MLSDSDIALQAALDDIGRVAVAVSGGVDSMTLAHVAHRHLGRQAEMYHAVSPAVPREATDRVRRHAAEAGWVLHVVDAGETSDERYVANPVDRCFYCKTNLYRYIAGATDRTIISGTNADDLGDYRPGLQAAADHGVRHPYIEVDIDKDGVRAIAHRLGLEDLAELPAAPCLSSRIETGIRVTTKRLSIVDEVERFLRQQLSADHLRCRVRSTGIVIEVDAALVEPASAELGAAVQELLTELGAPGEPTFEPYRRGGAFLRGDAS